MPIWRYLDFMKFLSMMHTRSLHFTALKDFDDPFEGVYPTISHLRTKLSLPTELPKDILDDLMKFVRHGVYVNCWSGHAKESVAMWRLYGSEGSVVVRSSFDRLSDALPNEFDIGKMNYIDYDSDHPAVTDLVRFPVFHKRIEYDFEQEVRVARVVGWDNWDQDVKVDLSSLVTAVRIRNTEPKWVVDMVGQVCEENGLSDRFSLSVIEDPPIRLTSDPKTIESLKDAIGRKYRRGPDGQPQPT